MAFLNSYKEYFNMATFKMPVLLPIKSWTFFYLERLSTSSYTAGVIQTFSNGPVFSDPNIRVSTRSMTIKE